MSPMQSEFYSLLKKHASWWHQAGYLTSRHCPASGNFTPGSLPQSFLDHAKQYAELAAFVATLRPMQFHVWAREHRDTYTFLYSSLTLFYAHINAQAA